MSQTVFPFSPAGKSIRIHEPPFVIMSDLRDRGRDCRTTQGKVSSKFMSMQMSSDWALWTLRWHNINYRLSPEVEAGTKWKARGEWFFFKCVLLKARRIQLLEPVRPAGSLTGDAGPGDIWSPLQGTVAFPFSIPVHDGDSVPAAGPSTDPEGWSRRDHLICWLVASLWVQLFQILYNTGNANTSDMKIKFVISSLHSFP